MSWCGPWDPAYRLLGCAFLENGQNVACGVPEPGDVWPFAAEDPPRVLFHAFVSLEADAPLCERVNGGVDVVDLEVEDREGRWVGVGLLVDERVTPASEVEPHEAVLLGCVQLEGLPVEAPCLVMERVAIPLYALALVSIRFSFIGGVGMGIGGSAQGGGFDVSLAEVRDQCGEGVRVVRVRR
jgi:hypothetical protein